jgi:hypothetical protein
VVRGDEEENRKRAKYSAPSFGFMDFKGSTGWLHQFLKRQSICHITGEKGDATKDVAAWWKEEQLTAVGRRHKQCG